MAFIHLRYRIIPALLYFSSAAIFLYLAYFDVLTFSKIMLFTTGAYTVYIAMNFFFSVVTIFKIRSAEATDYKQLLESLNTQGKEPYKVRHYVVIPNYKEPMEVLEETIEKVMRSSISKEQIGIVLAMEEAEANCELKAQEIIGKYKNNFFDMIYSVHPSGIPGEQRGKGSNTQWGCAHLEKVLNERGADKDNVILTITDSDTWYHEQFFEALTYTFITEEQRHQTFYQTPIFSYLNIDVVPFATRIMAILGAVNELSRSTNPLDLHITFSCYSLSYNFWSSFGGFDVNNIAEDVRAYLKAFHGFHGETKTKMIFLPTLNYLVDNTTFFTSISDRYTQAKRHAWGILEYAYFYQKMVEKGITNFFFKTMRGLFHTLLLMFRLVEPHYSPAILFTFSQLFGIVSFLYTKYGKDKELNFYLSQIAASGINLGLTIVILQVFLFLIHTYLLFRYTKTNYQIIPYYFIEYMILMTPAIYLMGCIPAWISAVKMVQTDEFVYITATKIAPPKPNQVQV